MNPVVHVDPIGTILFPLVGMLFAAAGTRRAADRLGEAGAVLGAQPVAAAARRDPDRAGRSGQQPAAGDRRLGPIRCRGRRAGFRPISSAGRTGPLLGVLARRPVHQPRPGDLQPDPDPAARWRQGAVEPAAAAVRASPSTSSPASTASSLLYALLLTGVAGADRAAAHQPPRVPAAVVVKKRVVSGMRPTGKLHLGHLVGALRNWVELQDQFDCFYFVADWHALTSEYADTKEITASALDNAADWIAAGARSGEEHAVHPVAGAGARRAAPAAVDDRADAVARARPDLQGAAGAGHRSRPRHLRLPRLPAAADRGHRHLQRARGAGGRGPGAAPRAVARDRAPLQRALRRGLRRAAADAHPVRAPARRRQPQDEQELPQRHQPLRHP